MTASKSKTISFGDLNIAIAWLECNEGSDQEADACKRVADLLRRQRDDRTIRRVAKAAKSPMSRAREFVKRVTDAGPRS